MPRLLLVFILASVTVVAQSKPFTAKVIGIADGDTINVLQDGVSKRIRLWGIDGPESGQAFGARAKQFTAELAFGKILMIDVRSKDRYQRQVAEVVLPDGRNLNHEIVRAGFAWWFVKYARQDARLARLELDARDARRGLWKDEGPVPPWQFRNAKSGVLQ